MLSNTTLRLLNSTALTAMSNILTLEFGRLSRRMGNARSRLVRLTGQHQQTNRQGNKRLYQSPNSGKIGDEKTQNKLASIKSSIDTMSMLLNSGNDVFRSGGPGGNIGEAIQQARNELYQQFPPPSQFKSAFANNKIRRVYSAYMRLQTEVQAMTSQLSNINSILQERAEGVSEEPKLNYDALLLGSELSESEMATISQYELLAERAVIKPYRKSKAFKASINAQLRDKRKTGPDKHTQFDLIYGPPVSTDGKFILSEDGLYYDSRNGGIPLTEKLDMASDTWKLKTSPYLGGRGQAVTLEDFNLISETIFSEDFKPDDPEGTIDRLTSIDEVLQTYTRDRNLHHTQIEAQITELIETGFSSSSPTVVNYRRSQAATSDAYESKIVKRKKQVQLFALFGGIEITESDHALGQDIILKTLTNAEVKHLLITNGYKANGSDVPITASDGAVRFGDLVMEIKSGSLDVRKRLDRVPLNDFSYLKGTGVIPDLKTQRRIVISENIGSIVDPVEPMFVKGNPLLETIYLKNFNVDDISRGDFIKSQGGVSGTGATYKSIGDSLVTEGLEVCYNFLKPDVVAPHSGKYELDNFAEGSTALNGKFVASSTSHAFPSGVSIPFLRGAIYNPETKYGIYYRPIDLSDIHNNEGGCYVRLPNNIKKGGLYSEGERVNGLTYSEKGWSIDFWTHVPDVSAGLTGHHRYRVVAACENSGNNPREGQFITASVKENDMGPVRGMVIGFRDKAVSGAATIGSDSDRAWSTGQLEFVILPTVGQNSLVGAQAGWEWDHSVAIQEKDVIDASEGMILTDPLRSGNTSSGTELGMIIPVSKTTTAGKSCSSCDTEFSHYVISFDYATDSASVYLDGQSLATSSISTAFNTRPSIPLNIPSPINPVRSSIGSWIAEDKGSENIAEGFESNSLPRYPIFTPWILGGGYTDMVGPATNRPGATTPLGFLGYNTNDQYKIVDGRLLSTDIYGSFVGQHVAGIGGQVNSGSTRKIPRSGLDGFIGSFKMYSKSLDMKEVEINYNAQRGYFKNIETYRS